jgi:hypothetical protein
MNTQHTQMETNLLQRKFSHIKGKRRVTFKSLVLRCWYAIPTKFLLILDQNFLAYKQQLYLLFLFLYFFTYFPLLTTLTTITYSSSLRPILLSPISLAFTQKDRPSICTFKSNPFFFFLFLFYFYPIRPNISYLHLQPHLTLSGTMLKNLP